MSLEEILQTTVYSDCQRKGTPSNLSHDIMTLVKMMDEGIANKELGGTQPQRTRNALDKLVPKNTLSADIPRLKKAGISDVRVRFQPGVGHSTDGLLTTELSEYLPRATILAHETLHFTRVGRSVHVY